jgi:Carboxypeptidase regulatory-like domain
MPIGTIGKSELAHSSANTRWLPCHVPRNLLCLTLYLLFCCLPGLAQSRQVGSIENALNGAPAISLLLAQEMPGRNDQQSLGTISGTVVDQNGNAVVSALVRLARDRQTEAQQAVSDTNGHFSFTGVAAGPFQLTVSAEGFATQTKPGTLHAGETFVMPDISLPVASAITEVRVSSLTKPELAEVQIKVEEKQRVLGFIPNFYVSYDPNAVSLTAKQKFELAWKTSVDPVSFAASGAVAGVEQAENEFAGYGQGAQGYAKRYGAAYADGFIGTMIGGAILPSLFKQDPRYFYKGSGSTRSRILYALANAVICKDDDGHWRTNYSGILGSLAAGGISNLYYPASSRDGVQLTFENTLIGIASSGAANIFQEFLVRKLTPHASGPQYAKP